MRKTIIVLLILLAGNFCLAAQEKDYYQITEDSAREYVNSVKKGEHHNVLVRREAVPDSDTAIALSLIVWKKIYGEKQIEKQAPFQAIRIDDCWFVTGSLPKGWRGGTAEAVIRSADGSFLNISHGK